LFTDDSHPGNISPELPEILGLRLQVLHASSEQEFEPIFSATAQVSTGGLVFTADPYFANRSEQLAELAIRYARNHPIS
jgi:putative ABC transport system substrate-binding protein